MAKIFNYSWNCTYDEKKIENVNLEQLRNDVYQHIGKILFLLKCKALRNANVQIKEFSDLSSQDNLTRKNELPQQVFSNSKLQNAQLSVVDKIETQNTNCNIENETSLQSSPTIFNIPLIEMKVQRSYKDENLELLEIQSVSSMNQFDVIQQTQYEAAENKKFGNLGSKVNLKQLQQFCCGPVQLTQSKHYSQDYYEGQVYKCNIAQVSEEEESDHQSKSHQGAQTNTNYQCDFLEVPQIHCRRRSRTAQAKIGKMDFEDVQIIDLGTIEKEAQQHTTANASEVSEISSKNEFARKQDKILNTDKQNFPTKNEQGKAKQSPELVLCQENKEYRVIDVKQEEKQ